MGESVVAVFSCDYVDPGFEEEGDIVGVYEDFYGESPVEG